MTQDIAKEEEKSNVISMGAFLLARRNRQVQDANALYEKAKKLSKHDNPNNDPFASVLMKRHAKMVDKINDIDEHIKFIMSGGIAASMMQPQHRGYAIPVNPNPPPVRFSFDINTTPVTTPTI